ncbi:MAG: TrkH family potassium uptake protein [Crocinitomicaceae bacterium]
MSRNLIHGKVIAHVVANAVIMMGALMLLALPFSIYYKENDFYPILFSSLITLFVGLGLRFATNKSKNDEIKKRDGYLIVTLSWLSMAIFGTLPYLISGAIPDISFAFFESMSGLTTTGATVLDDIESLPKGILFWRSMTQWIGGMGIIVLTIAILPLLGIGGMELFVAEAPGPTKDKIHPRIKETAKRLWAIYLMLTLAETAALYFSGMNFYDAINHSLTTCSSGGFSTKQNSIAAFNSPLIEMIILFFMFVAGTNFTLLYFGFKGRFGRFWNNDEFKWYLGALIGLVVIVTPIVFVESGNGFIQSLRESAFQVVSIVTTTGYATADYTSWGSLAIFIFFLLLFSGASAGSTSGGIKIVRIVLLMKNGFLEFKKRLHPNAIIPVHLNKQIVPPHIIYNLLAFIFLYLFIFTIGAVAMTAFGEPFDVALSASATSISNVGPGISSVGPAETFADISNPGKWVLSFLMLFGRLELFTVALLFTPYYWRRN